MGYQDVAPLGCTRWCCVRRYNECLPSLVIFIAARRRRSVYMSHPWNETCTWFFVGLPKGWFLGFSAWREVGQGAEVRVLDLIVLFEWIYRWNAWSSGIAQYLLLNQLLVNSNYVFQFLRICLLIWVTFLSFLVNLWYPDLIALIFINHLLFSGDHLEVCLSDDMNTVLVILLSGTLIEYFVQTFEDILVVLILTTVILTKLGGCFLAILTSWLIKLFQRRVRMPLHWLILFFFITLRDLHLNNHARADYWRKVA